jgi:hypothetical protein
MSDALIDLLFWVVVFTAMLFGFRWWQRRGRGKDGDE